LHGSGQPAVIDGPGGTGSSRTSQTAPAPPSGAAGLSGPGVALLPAAVTLLAGLYRISGPSFSKDEAATLAAVHRGFPQLIRMLGHVDVGARRLLRADLGRGPAGRQQQRADRPAALRAGHGGRGRRCWLAGYGATLALLGFGNLFALLLVIGHAVTLLAWGAGGRTGAWSGAG
jgi:hypothetical protein